MSNSNSGSTRKETVQAIALVGELHERGELSAGAYESVLAALKARYADLRTEVTESRTPDGRPCFVLTHDDWIFWITGAFDLAEQAAAEQRAKDRKAMGLPEAS